MTRETPPYLCLALKVFDEMNIIDKVGKGIVIRFCKMYETQKIVDIVTHAKKYVWWEKNPKAAFMKAVGEVNRMKPKL